MLVWDVNWRAWFAMCAICAQISTWRRRGATVPRAGFVLLVARLEALLRWARAAVRFSSHVVGDGPRVFAEAEKHGLEGIVSKAVDQPYRPRNRDVWVKTKALKPPGIRGRRIDRSRGKLAYAGRAGTGMTDAELRGLVANLRSLASDRMPLHAPPPKNTRGKPLVLSRVHWVRPKLVAEVTY